MKDNRSNTTQETLKLLEDGIKSLVNSDTYKTYLKIMSRFHSYSFGNCILIMMQNPAATHVAGYRAWQQKFHRQVKKGAKAIRVIAPCTYEKQHDDGTTTQETYFKAASVFDIEQTDSLDGEEFPEVCHKLTGTVDDYDLLLKALTEISTVPISFEDIPGTTNGFFHPKEKRIVVRADLDQKQKVKTLIHEIAHSILHDPDTGECKDDDRNMRETAAESTAFTVMYWLGLPSDDYSFAYLAAYTKDFTTLPEFHACLNSIQKTADSIIKQLEQKGIKSCMKASVKP